MAVPSGTARGARVIRVFIVDQSSLFRAGMCRAIESEPDLKVVGEATDLEQAAEVVPACRPDVIVAGSVPSSGAGTWRAALAAWALGLDTSLSAFAAAGGQQAGQSAHAGVRQTYATVAVVDVGDAGREVLDAVMDAFTSGVLACLDRSASPEDLVYAIRAAARGHQYASPRLVRVLVEGVARLRDVASGFEEAVLHAMAAPSDAVAASSYAGTEGARHRLTAREREVLSLVARGKSNREIARMLSISEKTVKNHVSNLLHKLGADRRTQAAIWAISQGFSGSGGSQDEGPMTKVPSKNEPSG